MRASLFVTVVLYLGELLAQRCFAEQAIVIDANSQKVISAVPQLVTESDQITVVITDVNTYADRCNVQMSRRITTTFRYLLRLVLSRTSNRRP